MINRKNKIPFRCKRFYFQAFLCFALHYVALAQDEYQMLNTKIAYQATMVKNNVEVNNTTPNEQVGNKTIAKECLAIENGISLKSKENKRVFFIECIGKFPNNYLQVFNRWGTEVFEMKGYDNSWEGTSTGAETMGAVRKLPIGTYYYTLDLGDGESTKNGWLYITK